MDKETANGAARYKVLGNKIFTVPPIKAQIRWPPIRLRGSENGLSMMPSTNTLEAPKEPIR